MRGWLKWFLAGPDSANELLKELADEAKRQTHCYQHLENRVHLAETALKKQREINITLEKRLSALESVETLKEQKPRIHDVYPKTWSETKALMEKAMMSQEEAAE
jgi:hypothetical protein